MKYTSTNILAYINQPEYIEFNKTPLFYLDTVNKFLKKLPDFIEFEEIMLSKDSISFHINVGSFSIDIEFEESDSFARKDFGKCHFTARYYFQNGRKKVDSTNYKKTKTWCVDNDIPKDVLAFLELGSILKNNLPTGHFCYW